MQYIRTPMTPQKFKEARQTLGLTQQELAYILNSNPRTVRRWETDDDTRPVNPVAQRVIEWMLDGYRPPQLLWMLDGYRPPLPKK